MKAKSSRREFLGTCVRGTAGAVGLPLIEPVAAWAVAGDMPYRTLGSTGEKVSLLGLGGFHLGFKARLTAAESTRIIRTAIDNGVNFMDNSWDYHGGESEVRMGQALADGYRKKVFLMTKTDGLVKDVWNRQLEECLRRLQTDVVDLVQFHEINLPSDPDVIFGPGGAIEAAVAAKQAGKIRHIGFTGHRDPDILLKMLDTASSHHFTFDAVQLPLNVMDAHYRSFARQVVPVLVERGIAVLGMKSLGGGRIPKTNTVTPTECLQYTMNLKTSVVITGCETLKDLEQGLEAARNFKPMGEAAVAALLEKTAPVAANGQNEYYKTADYERYRRWRSEWFMGTPPAKPS